MPPIRNTQHLTPASSPATNGRSPYARLALVARSHAESGASADVSTSSRGAALPESKPLLALPVINVVRNVDQFGTAPNVFAPQAQRSAPVSRPSQAWAAPSNGMQDNRLERAFLQLGKHLYKTAQKAKAASVLEMAIRHVPESATLRLHLALTQIELMQYAKAKTSLQSLVERDATHADAHYLLGRIEINEGHFETAATYFRSAMSRGTTFAAARGLGLAYAKMGHLGAAEKALGQGLGRDPDGRTLALLMIVQSKLGLTGLAARSGEELFNYRRMPIHMLLIATKNKMDLFRQAAQQKMMTRELFVQKSSEVIKTFTDAATVRDPNFRIRLVDIEQTARRVQAAI